MFGSIPARTPWGTSVQIHFMVGDMDGSSPLTRKSEQYTTVVSCGRCASRFIPAATRGTAMGNYNYAVNGMAWFIPGNRGTRFYLPIQNAWAADPVHPRKPRGTF